MRPFGFFILGYGDVLLPIRYHEIYPLTLGLSVYTVSPCPQGTLWVGAHGYPPETVDFFFLAMVFLLILTSTLTREMSNLITIKLDDVLSGWENGIIPVKPGKSH